MGSTTTTTATAAALSSMSGGVAKKIALFEFVPPESTIGKGNANGNGGPTRLRRKDAIKRKKAKNSHPIFSSTATTEGSDLETQTQRGRSFAAKEQFKTTRTLWLTSAGESSSDSYGSSLSSASSARIKPDSITTTSSSEDYELQEFNAISAKMRANIALVDEILAANNKVINSRINPSQTYDDIGIGLNTTTIAKVNRGNKFEKFLQNRATRSLREGYYQSFSLPRLKPGDLRLVEFNDAQINSSSQSDGDLTEDEPFYEELDPYYNKIIEGKQGNENDTNGLTRSGQHSISLLLLGSKKDEETTPSSTYERPPTPPPYESLYSELIYNAQQHQHPNTPSLKSSASSFYNSSNATTTPQSHTTDPIYLNNVSTPKCNKNLTGLNPQGSSLPCFYNNSISSQSSLPPLPNAPSINSVSGSSSSTSSGNISIAKLAGDKLSKKFKFLRKLSKSSLDGNSGVGTEISSNDDRRTSVASVESQGIKKMSISRPNIPPPEPPRNPPAISAPTLAPVAAPTPTPVIQLPPKDILGHDDHNDDDSDFYDSDSELIRNFVAAVQPIYSMEEEPLYQYYAYGITLKPEDNYQPVIPKNLGLTLDMLIPRTGQRTLWCEIPEVISSGILGILSDQQKKLQEAIFEVLTSEVSYLKSLNVLVSLFYENSVLVKVLSKQDRATLFGNITEVKDCSQSFLAELLNKWEESWYIQEVGQIISSNAHRKFHVYKDYCRNKPCQDKILQKLRSSNDEFVNIIKSIEEDPKCQMLRMDSFLMLPMQRITRLPLLVNAIIQRTQSSKEKSNCEDALRSLTNLVMDCNESARESQDAEETAEIFEKIEFPKNTLSVPYPGQFLLKGDFIRTQVEQQGMRGSKLNWSFQKKKPTLYWLILFTNQLFITRKKSSGKFEVIDMIAPSESSIKPVPNYEVASKDFQHYFMLQSNKHDGVYLLAARTQSEMDRWRQTLNQLKSQRNLQVEAIFLYEAKRSDELSFTVGDIICVSQIQPDGWYYGRKLNTNETGWFPGNYCAEC